MKKILSIITLCFVLLISAGCGNTANNGGVDNDKKTVVATTSFIADMVNQIAGDKVNVEMVIPAGEDPHLYVAKPDDLNKIKKADLVLYHGLHFEGKMNDILEKKGAPVTKNFTEKEVGKMEEDGNQIIDPHFWFDINLYKKAVDEASIKLSELLPDNKDEFMKKAKEYNMQLDKLNEENKKMLDEIPAEHRYLITPHDAFNYFSIMYNIEVVAPQGVSTDSEIANKDIEKTADFIVKHKIKAIFSESTTNPERMNKLKEIVKAKGFDVNVVSGEGKELFSDSLAPTGKEGSTYIDMYKHNVKLIYDNLK
ncbi:metal ABC transporter solute-binding protein, Zn/Mn family [Peptostreptococcus canis]|uniref:Zinc ABC transporter solute-binding protein n=1 Tax=Peptostreptococcus canis TaxID=1159213 RepID=A0ABR6TIS4_9FIRM|nr:zinc ABC transporter substrate-binding protein [Peptostreptococcus canis]MBC2575316.1 zinc ABC transporter solute-binding protein [Peptostreptococcus canis]MBP1997501.1 manganese/zinc/iron transport system substrate-binding protein [Peptostreptococcus canis]